jgi:RNA polymerase sigma-70 factor (ECF subfamily)
MKKRWLDGLTVSEETSLSLLARAKQGDAVAVEALMGRYLARLQRWASGRVPSGARSLLDTDDVVQDALMNTFRRLDDFTPRHDGALMAYLRQAVANRIRMELRRRHPVADASIEPDGLASSLPSPLETVVGRDAFARYEQALAQLDEDDRAAVIGRFEMGLSYDALARALERPSSEAARKAVERAVRRLVGLMKAASAGTNGRRTPRHDDLHER